MTVTFDVNGRLEENKEPLDEHLSSLNGLHQCMIEFNRYITFFNKILKIDDNISLKANGCVLIIGCGGSGKTATIKSIMKRLPREIRKDGLIVNLSEGSVPEYDSYKDMLVTSSYDDPIINGCIKSDKKGVIIVDNVINPYNFESKDIIRFFMPQNKLRIISMQYPFSMKKNVKDTVDYIFFLYDSNIMRQKCIYEEFCNFFPTFDSFKEKFIKYTSLKKSKTYKCMVINNRTKSTDIHKKVFCYRL